MKIKSQVLDFLHLDSTFSLLTAKNTRLVLAYFSALDVHGLGKLNDIQFYQFMRHVTNLNKRQIFLVLDMLDQEATGYIAFPEFYLLTCILIALKDRVEKQFIFRHSKLVFEMMDEDGGGTISADEFGQYGFLFNLKDHSVRDIFFEFDVSGDEVSTYPKASSVDKYIIFLHLNKELDYKEFKMFAMACIDKQKEMDEKKKERLLKSMNNTEKEKT